MQRPQTSSPPGGGQGPRVVLVDPAFGDARSGHHWRLNKGYGDLLGWERTWVAAARSLTDAPGIPQDRIIGAFGTSFYDAGERVRRGRLGRALQALAYRDDTGLPRQARTVIQAMLRRRRSGPATATPRRSAAQPSLYSCELSALIDALSLGPDDHMAFTSLDAEMGRAILDLIMSRRAEDLPALHLRLMYGDATETASPLDYEGLIERLSATGLIGGRITLHAEAPVQAATLARRTGGAVGVAPFPAAPLPPPESPEGRPIVIAYLGEARAERGFDRLEGVMAAFAKRHAALLDRVAWRIHAGGRTIEAARARDRVRAARSGKGMDVAYRFGAIDPEAYERLRAEADIVLAPQDPAVYAERGSGVAQEAVAGGRPLVCLEGSSLAQEAGAVATARSDEELADALASIVNDPPIWFDRARRGAAAFAERVAASSLVAACASPAQPGVARPVALLVGPSWPQGGSGALMALQARTLTQLGFQVARLHLARPGQSMESVLTSATRGEHRDRDTVLSLAIAAAPGRDGAWDGAPADAALDQLCRSGRIGLLVANFAAVARWTARLPLAPTVPRIVETHELALDPATGLTLAEAASPPAGFHAAVFVNRQEATAWSGASGLEGFTVIPPLDDRLETGEPGSSVGPTHDLIFVGSNHERNRRALRRLESEILASPAFDRVSLLVAGDVEAEPGRPATTRLRRVGDLDRAYRDARVAVAPHAPGGGLPTKVLGALARGMPLVADAEAVLFLDDPEPFAARDLDDFRMRIQRALADPAYRDTLAAASRSAWQKLASQDRYLDEWRSIVAAIGGLPGDPSRPGPNRV
jgi:glycosyltransferase involved in cell wall biosynthesis